MTLIQDLRHAILIGFCLLILGACEQAASPVAEPVSEPVLTDSTQEAATSVTLVGDRYYATALEQSPEIAYFSGIELPRHDGMQDNSPAARQALEVLEDEMLAALESIDVSTLKGRNEWITHAYLLQELRASAARRICRNDLWNVNQMGGWHSGYTQIAQLQPVGTAELREQSLIRWSKMAAYADQEIENLKNGLALGYSAPKSVVLAP